MFENSIDTNVCSWYTVDTEGGNIMEILKSKSIIAFIVMILGVSYLTALDNVNASNSQNVKEIISEKA